MKFKNNHSDNTENENIEIHKIITTSVSLTNANIFFITDKKSILFVRYLHMSEFTKLY